MKGIHLIPRAASTIIALIFAHIPACAFATLLSGTGGAPTDPVFLGPAIQTFDSAPTGLFTSQTLGNNTFTALDGSFDVSPNYVGQYNTLGVNSLQSGFVTNPVIKPHQIEFLFTIPLAAVAFNWGAADNVWQMKAFDSGNNLLESAFISLPNSSVNNGEYFGFVNIDIKRVVLIDQLDAYPDGDHIFIDDFTTSFESAPEPASAAILLLGASVASLRRARKSLSITRAVDAQAT
jgi:hypothetical protein